MDNKILIATDGSKYSQKAVDYGIELAGKIGASVMVLYVVNMRSLEMYAISHHDDIGGYESADLMLKDEGRQALDYALAAAKKAGVEASEKMTRGYPADEIIRLSERECVSMIVMGSLGKTGLEHLLLGSVSEDVVKKAPCPVLVVRGDTNH